MGLFLKKRKDDRQYNADDDTGGNGKVEGVSLFLYVNVTGEAAEAGYLRGDQNQYPRHNKYDSQKYQYLTDCRHIDPRKPPVLEW